MVVPAGTQNLVDNTPYQRVPCAIVLEGNPTDDNRLNFESFPEGGIEEAYNVQGYEEMANRRMPQPGYVVYRGGNWSTFSLELKFRAGDRLGREVSLQDLTTTDLDSILVGMERKVRWLQALQFPLEREAIGIQRRVRQRAITGGFSQDALAAVNAAQLRRNDPPYVIVVIGSFLVFRAYVTSWSAKWEHPYHPVTAQPYGCTVNVAFQRLDLEYPTFQTIRNSAGKLPQTPYNPRIRGEVNLRQNFSRGVEGIRAAQNAQAVANANAAAANLSVVN